MMYTHIDVYMHRELKSELAALNAEIDRRIERGLTRSKHYKRLLSEHRTIRALLSQ